MYVLRILETHSFVILLDLILDDVHSNICSIQMQFVLGHLDKTVLPQWFWFVKWSNVFI